MHLVRRFRNLNPIHMGSLMLLILGMHLLSKFVGFRYNQQVEIGTGILMGICCSIILIRKSLELHDIFKLRKNLEENEIKYRTLVENLPDIVIRFDRDLRHLYVNPMLEKISGLKPADILGKTHREIGISLEQCVFFEENLKKVFTSGNPAEVEFKSEDPKNPVLLSMRMVPESDASGNIQSVLAIIRNITEIRQNEELLQKSQEHLKQLNQQVVTAQEKERQRISRELHDEIGQALTALKIGLSLLQSELPADRPDLARQLAEITNLTGETLEQLRNLARDLRPPALDTLGLNLTLEDYCREYGRRTNTNITYAGTELPELSGEVRITLYRFVQEALTNVVKHALANRVWITLEWQDNQLKLTIRDDGMGFADFSDNMRDGIGLAGIRERLEMLGGKLTVDSVSGEGSTLTATIGGI